MKHIPLLILAAIVLFASCKKSKTSSSASQELKDSIISIQSEIKATSDNIAAQMLDPSNTYSIMPVQTNVQHFDALRLAQKQT